MKHTTPAKGKGSRLNARQLAFVNHIVSGKTYVDAYRAAGYKASTPGAAEGGSSALMANPMVKAAVRHFMEKAAEKVGVTAEMVVGRFWVEALGLGPDTKATARVAALDKLARKLGLYAADRGGAEADGLALIARLVAAQTSTVQVPARALEGEDGR